VQGIVAAGASPSSFRRASRTPMAYLSSLQQTDGSFRYSRSSAQTPVWVTSQVVAALRRKTFPVRAPARRRAHVAPASSPAPAAQRKRRPAPRREVARREREDELGASTPVIARPVAARPAARRVAVAPRAPEGGGPGAAQLVGAAAAAAVVAGGLLLWRRRHA
jgi:hypothetical protein